MEWFMEQVIIQLSQVRVPIRVFSEKRTNVFTLCAVKAWNELPEDVWAPSLYSFIG